MEVIIVRHGLSESNKADEVGGPDTPLAEEGLQQAEELAERLAGLEIDAIYSSTMPRAIDTAKPIAKKIGKEVIMDERLCEVDFGAYFYGKPHEILKEELGGISGSDAMDSYVYDFSKWGGETSQEVESRLKSFLEDLKKQPYELALIVCHGGVVRWLHYLITGEKITRQANAEELHLKTP